MKRETNYRPPNAVKPPAPPMPPSIVDNVCRLHPSQVFQTLKRFADRTFVLDELVAQLKLNPTIADHRASVIWCATRLHEHGKIEIDYPVNGKEFGYRWPAPIQEDWATGRKYKDTWQGRVWLKEAA